MTKITILGCGSSNGVPSIGLGWGNCNPYNPKNRRLRSSIFVEKQSKKILIDVTPDFREQALTHNINHIDAIFFTHAHADHTHGIDDLRWINIAMQKPINIYASAITLSDIENRFGYVFKPLASGINFFYKPVLISHTITQDIQDLTVSGIKITTFKQYHGACNSLGLKIGNFVYSTDVVDFPEDSKKYLYNLDVWVVDCLRYNPHKTHAHLNKVLGWVEEFKPKKVYMTHMSILFDYQKAILDTPKNVLPAYDGLIINLNH